MVGTKSSETNFGRALAQSFLVNDAMNQLILEALDPGVWRIKPPGPGARTIAAVFAHTHNVRRKWIRLTAPHLALPKELNRTRCTQPQVSKALAESAKRCSEILEEAIDRPKSQVQKFHRDGWARPWPVGAAMFAYMIAHDAHHRGQVCMLAHQFGCPLPQRVTSEMWAWERLWRRCGFGVLR